jgi:hypothetical protein
MLGGCGLDYSGYEQEYLAVSRQYGSGQSDLMKSGKFLYQLSDCQFLKEDFTPWS